MHLYSQAGATCPKYMNPAMMIFAARDMVSVVSYKSTVITLTVFENPQYVSDSVLYMMTRIAHIVDKPLFDESFLFLS